MVVWKMDLTGGKANAQKVYDEIRSIEDRTPQNIVDFARDENSELHKCFEWDDSKAGELYRRQQARIIVCHLVVEAETEESKEPIKLRVLESVENHYEPVKMIIQKQDEYAKLLERAYAELRAFKQRYSNLVELQEILALID